MRRGPLVVVGDALLDVDLAGTAERLAPDAPVPVIDCHRERHRAGGAGLAAVLAAGLAGPVVLVTALGDDGHGARLRDLLGGHVEVVRLPLRGGTPCKIRVLASGRPVARLDAGDGRAAPGPLGAAAERALRSAGGVLVADYGRGVAAHPGLREILTRLPARVPVIWDPHPRGVLPLPGIRLATPNQREARGFAGSAAAGGAAAAGRGPEVPLAWVARDGAALSRAWGTAVAVTLGERGALLSVGDDTPFLAPPPAIVARPHDVCGAGDCFAAAAAQVLCDGGLLTEAVTEAVRAASDFVARGGAADAPGLTIPPEPGSRQAGVPAPQPAGEVWDLVADIRRHGGRVVATGGCFDLLHAGHVGLLRQARRLGDCLIVCLNSDTSVRALKGPGRPLVAAQDRARVLAALECVDAVLVFDEPTPVALLDRLRPDVWVKGGDYARGELAEAPVVRRYGGEVVLLPYTGHSTSQIVAAAQAQAEPARP